MTEWLAPLAALVGAFGGAWLQQRHGVKVMQLQQREGHRARLQELLAEVIADASETVENGWLMMPFYAQMSTSDMTEFVETDTALEMSARNKRLTRNLVRLRLQTADEPLRQAVGVLADAIKDWPDKAVDPVLQARKDGASVGKAAIAGMEHVRHTRDATRLLERVASDFIKTPLRVERLQGTNPLGSIRHALVRGLMQFRRTPVTPPK